MTMKFRGMRKFKCIVAAGLMALGVATAGAQQKVVAQDVLADAFKSPPDASKPWVIMWWFETITPEDITLHLEALKEKGVGGFLLVDLAGMPKAKFLSEPWRVLFRHTVREAARLEMKMASNVCVGWPSGGEWTTPENSAWMSVSSTLTVGGGRAFQGKLPEPAGRGVLYKDVAVQAFKVSPDAEAPSPTISLNGKSDQLPNLLDGNYNTGWKTEGIDSPAITIDFGAPKKVDWIWLEVAGTSTLESSQDGKVFTKVWSGDAMPWHNVIYEAIPATSARWYRIHPPAKSLVRDFSIGSKDEVQRFAGLVAKRGSGHPLGVLGTTQSDQMAVVNEHLRPLPGDAPLLTQDMVDLSDKVSADGTLNWEVPAGRWKVVRVGQTTTGIHGFDGLLPDYLSPSATDQNFEQLKKLIDDAGPHAGKTFEYFHEDNVEIEGLYSWSPAFLEEFRKRRGYEPTPYMATLAGEIVESLEITGRFLADVRRTIADCVADHHYGRWASLAHSNGMKVRSEAGGQHHPRLLCNDGLLNQGKMDVPLAEFWENNFWRENQYNPRNHHLETSLVWNEMAQNVNAKQAASAGHLYGKNIVGTEAFTSIGGRTNWQIGPSDLLLNANIAFCEGLNGFYIHGSATSGVKDGKPGKAFACGSHFNHNITWWETAAKPFLTYLSRCQHLLRQGVFVADVLYYAGDEVPCYVPPKTIDPSRGFGYDYDVCNTDVLLHRLSVKDGMLVTPEGVSYRVLVLPVRGAMPLPVMRKIEELVLAGATVLGPKPVRTVGLSGYPESEQTLKEVADRLWVEKQVGKGRVIECRPIREVLLQDGVAPDIHFKSANDSDYFDYIHRRDGDTDIYFITNRRARTTPVEVTFRVKGKLPELWNPKTGESRSAANYQNVEHGTMLPLELDPYGSMFVVFRHPVPEDAVPKQAANFVTWRPLSEIKGSWEVSFDTAWGGPGKVTFDELASWTTRPETGIRYYSGEAIYQKTFDLPEGTKPEGRLSLDLGSVKNVAEVSLNGKNLGVAWTAPFRFELTGTLRQSGNKLEIKIVNLWCNRLAGDVKLPKEQQITRTNVTIDPKVEPLESGLLGPVKVLTAE
jgi:hypothetical protein